MRHPRHGQPLRGRLVVLPAGPVPLFGARRTGRDFGRFTLFLGEWRPDLHPAFLDRRRATGRWWKGVDDLPGTLAKVTDDAPVVLLAHEPDIFPAVSDRVAVTLSGHTHGGQVRILGYAPFVPSRYGDRYAYGHVAENGRNLIVSGGLGCSSVPLRIGSPPELVLVELGSG